MLLVFSVSDNLSDKSSFMFYVYILSRDVLKLKTQVSDHVPQSLSILDKNPGYNFFVYATGFCIDANVCDESSLMFYI